MCVCHWFFWAFNSHARTQNTFRVAVVGAGISGSATAYYLRTAFPVDDVAIDVYETRAAAGGRVRDLVLTVDGSACFDWI